MIKVFINM